MELKKISTALGKNIHLAMPLIEEVTAHKLMVYCIIGAAPKPTKSGELQLRFATLCDEADLAVYQFCKAFVEQAKEKYEPLTPPHAE